MKSWLLRIAAQKTNADYNAIKVDILAAELTDEQKSQLMEENFKKSREVAAAAA